MVRLKYMINIVKLFIILKNIIWPKQNRNISAEFWVEFFLNQDFKRGKNYIILSYFFKLVKQNEINNSG